MGLVSVIHLVTLWFHPLTLSLHSVFYYMIKSLFEASTSLRGSNWKFQLDTQNDLFLYVHRAEVHCTWDWSSARTIDRWNWRYIHFVITIQLSTSIIRCLACFSVCLAAGVMSPTMSAIWSIEGMWTVLLCHPTVPQINWMSNCAGLFLSHSDVRVEIPFTEHRFRSLALSSIARVQRTLHKAGRD